MEEKRDMTPEEKRELIENLCRAMTPDEYADFAGRFEAPVCSLPEHQLSAAVLRADEIVSGRVHAYE
jgi:hypothetical protein